MTLGVLCMEADEIAVFDLLPGADACLNRLIAGRCWAAILVLSCKHLLKISSVFGRSQEAVSFSRLTLRALLFLVVQLSMANPVYILERIIALLVTHPLDSVLPLFCLRLEKLLAILRRHLRPITFLSNYH